MTVGTARDETPWVMPLLMALRSPREGGEARAAEVAPSRDPGELQRLKRRDPLAWEAFFAREMPAIFRYALSRLGDRPEAEDVTSEVFEEAWNHAARLEDHGLPARAWLFGIARHLVSTRRRRFLRKPPMLALDAIENSPGDWSNGFETIDLAQAVAALDARHAEVVSLRFIQGLSLVETASVLGLSIDSVKGRQARALIALRAELGTR
jgi:RNA polymerase sigma-70 factor (ECF subfamily)